jgi:HEAT repeat protein/energy-coupling factor transporter ATP-binding protein EcfA2
MAAEIDFQPYLQSISTHYAQWWQLYTLTNAETKAQQKNEPQPWKTPFDFGLMVQTVQRDRLVGIEGSGVEPQPKEKIERFPVLEGIRKYVKEHRQVLLVGRPGSGKSTTLARLLLEEAQNSFALGPPSPPILGGTRAQSPIQGVTQTQSPPELGDLGGRKDYEAHPESITAFPEQVQYIPVLVELRFWSGSILDRIQAFFQRHDLQLDRTQIEDLLFHQRLLLLMDGLNELPSEAARLDVAKFRQDYPKVSMIFTTRDLSLGGDFGLEKKLEMQPLTEAQMQAFVRLYVPEQAEAMLRQLKDRLREFGQTPLLLWMLCEVCKYSPDKQLPSNLGDVFRTFTKDYELNSVREHQVAVRKGDVQPLSDRDLWFPALKHLAAVMMNGKTVVDFRRVIDKTEAEQELQKIFSNEPNSSKTARDCLKDLLKYHLLQNKTDDSIEFKYQLIQEYYAAEYLLGHWEQLSELEFKRDYLNYLKWTESIKLMVGLANDENLILQVVKFGLDLDLRLGAQLAGKAKPELQPTTVGSVNELEVPEWLKIELWGETRSNTVIPRLVKALEHKDSDVRGNAAAVLMEMGSEQAISELVKALEDKNSDVRWIAAATLGKMCSESLFLRLRMALEDKDFHVRWNAADALGERGSEQAISGLLMALKDKDSLVRRNAADALGKMGSEQAIPGLLMALEDKNSDVRRSVADAVGDIKNVAVLHHLHQLVALSLNPSWQNPRTLLSTQANCKFYNYDLTQTTQANSKAEQPTASSPTHITYDLRGANIGNWAENQHGIQHTTQIHPHPSQPPETPQ